MSIAKRVDGFREFYYGWIIVAVSLVSLAFWIGIRSSFSIFYVVLLEEFPWNRGESAGVQSVAFIAYTIMAPLVGGLIDRFGPRRVIVPGILLLSLGLTLCATIETLSGFYVLYGVVMGAAITSISIVSYSALLAHWFEKKRGLASGIAVSGMGLGTFFFVQLSQWVILEWGWRMTFVVLGVLVLIILLPLNAIFLRHKPTELGRSIDGLRRENSPVDTGSYPMARKAPEADWTIRNVWRSGRFWALMAFTFLSIFGIFTIVVHNVKFLVDQGVNKMTAAFIFAMVGVVSTVFRIFWGWLSDRIGREMTFTLGMLCACMGAGSLLLLEAMEAKGFIYPFFIFFGMGWAVTAPIFISVAADLFKGKAFGLIYGIVEGGVGIAAAFGAWFGGFIFDRTQSYHWAFVLVIFASLLSCLFIWLTAPRKARPGSNEFAG